MNPLTASGGMPIGDGGTRYMLRCTVCAPLVPTPFPSGRERADWATSHTAETGHDEYEAWEEPR